MKKKKEVRQKFREKVFERDNHLCKMCPNVKDLDAHHITDRNEMPNGGYVKENGITLCPSCHLKAELWHTSGKETHHPGYHPNDLYKIITSSYDIAYKSSQELL